MRSLTTPERNRMSASHANYYLRVELKDSEANWRDLTNLSGVDWVDGATWTASIDSPTMTGSVSLKRETHSFSLAPLLTGSTLNLDSHGAYAPLLDVGREVRISSAVTAHGVAPIPADWKEVFLGYITEIAFEAEPITLTISDLGSRIVDKQIESFRDYGDAVAGLDVEDVIQSILDDNLGAGVVTLFTPTSPGKAITSFSPDTQSVMEALNILVQQIGWDIRYEYDSSDVFRFTLIQPDRAKTTPDATIGPNEYLSVSRLGISLADIRNVCDIFYVDHISGLDTKTTSSDPGSIAEYGRRYMFFRYQSTDQIDTAIEAQQMGDAAISDLSDPQADQEIEQFYFWPIQLGDLLQYSANGVHYDSAQSFGVYAYTHTLSQNTHRTSIQVRGQVAGAYKQWLINRNGTIPTTPTGVNTGPAPEIFPMQGESQAYQDATRDGMVWIEIAFESSTQSVQLFGMESATTPAPIPELSDSRRLYTLTRLPGDKWSADNVILIVPVATRTLYYRKVVAQGVGFDGTIGPQDVQEKQAIDVGVGPSGPPTTFAISSAGTTNRISWVNGDASANTIVFRNGFGIVVPPGITGFIDTGLPSDGAFTYAICHYKNGQTSPRIPDSGGGSGGGGGGGTVTPPSQNPTAPVWQAGYPISSGASSVIYAWTTDPAATEVAIELNPFTIVAEWEQLAVFTDVGHLPSGTLTDAKYPNGTQVQARIRSLVAGLEYYSAPVTVRYGVAPPVAPKFTNGTPENDGGSVYFEWTCADATATKLTITIIGVGVVYTTLVSGQIQAGSYTKTGSYGGKSVYATAFYPSGQSASTPTTRLSTAL